MNFFKAVDHLSKSAIDFVDASSERQELTDDQIASLDLAIASALAIAIRSGASFPMTETNAARYFAAMGGRSTSKAKAEAVRRNGMRGGRPRKRES